MSAIFSLLIVLPVSVWLVQKETKLRSSAYFERPNPIEIQTPLYGDVPQDQPEITLVWPFLGKPGDAVLIYGTNFGDNPKNKTLTFGGSRVEKDNILRWETNLIEFSIPNIINGTYYNVITISVGGFEASWTYPFTVYSTDTKIKIAKPDRMLEIENAPLNSSLEIYFNNGQMIERQINEDLTTPENNTILTIVLLNENDQPIPFYVEPAEFGF